MKITIYELLGLIKDGKAPKKIKVTGNIYEYDEEFEFYYTYIPKMKYRVLLGGLSDEINLVANAFNDNVEILDEEDEFIDIEEIEYKPRKVQNAINDLIKNQKKIINKLKEEGK